MSSTSVRWILASKLRALIRARDFTSYRQVAIRCGLKPQQFYHYVHGDHVPAPETLTKILAGLGATQDELLAAQPEPAIKLHPAGNHRRSA
jgi:transcriptional regulator with XRE-family HTH domain